MEKQPIQFEIPQDDNKGTPKPERTHQIEVDTLSQIKEHLRESFVTENINISEEKVKVFVEIVGNINPVHFDSSRVNESVFTEEAKGRIFVPGFYTLSLWSNKDGIYSALSIKEPHEVIIKGIENTKFLAPVFAGSDISYKFTIEAVVDSQIKTRNATEVVWKIIASTLINDRMRPCMTTKATLAYISLKKED